MLKLKDVMKMTGLSRSTIYAYIEQGIFPAQVKIGARSVAWIEKEVNEWINSRIMARGEAFR